MKHLRRLNRAVALWSIALLLMLGPTFAKPQAQAQSNDPPRYAVFDLGDLGGNAANAFAINDHGIVVGTAWFPGNDTNHAVAFRIGQSPLDLGTFGGSNSVAYDINNRNQIVGWADGADGARGAFVWDRNKLRRLGTLGGVHSLAYGMNDAGEIVGSAETGLPGLMHAFVWKKGQMVDLGAFHYDSEAHDINESSVIIGTSNVPTGAGESAVIWSGNDMIALGGIGGDYRSSGYAINDTNHAIGEAKNHRYRTRAFAWVKGKLRSLQQGAPDVHSSSALGMNNRNQIVGLFGEYGSFKTLAFLWEPQIGFQYLPEMVPPKMPLRITRAYDINEQGQIAAWGVLADGDWYRALLLTPVSPEITLSDPAPNIAGRINTWTIAGAKPGSRVTLAYSLRGGGATISNCDVIDAVMQLKNPKAVGSATADINGEAVIQLFVPDAARNLGVILFQALVKDDCNESPLSATNFQ